MTGVVLVTRPLLGDLAPVGRGGDVDSWFCNISRSELLDCMLASNCSRKLRISAINIRMASLLEEALLMESWEPMK